MTWLMNGLYLLALVLASPYLIWQAWRSNKYREGWSSKLLGWVPTRSDQNRCVWIHAVSVGEVNLLQSLLPRLEERYPRWTIVISTTTKTGYDLAKRRYAPRLVVYAPLDFTWAVRNALERLRPSLILLAELEIWPNLLAAASRRNIPVAIVNGRLSDKSFRNYSRFTWLVRSWFARLDLVAAQSNEYAERFLALGCRPAAVQTTGSLKFDGAIGDRHNPATRSLKQLANIHDDEIVFLAGSTQAPEEEFALQVFESLSTRHPRLRLLVVPRHPERFGEVAQMLQARGASFVRRSELTEQNPTTARILLVDAVGELGAWWGTAHIAFVGGSLGNRGGQNMIEPAAYGCAICFGPNTWNFRDVVHRFLAEEAAVVVRDENELLAFVSRMLESPDDARALGAKAAALVREQQGATARTLELLAPLFERDSMAPSSPEAVPSPHVVLHAPVRQPSV